MLSGHAARVWLAAVAAALAFLFQGCDRQPTRSPGPVRVVVTVPPLAGLVKPLLPESAVVTVLIPPGSSEHGYEFTAADLAALAQADLVVYVGLGLEPKVESYLALNPSKTRFDVCFATAVGIKPDPTAPHDHEHETDHEEHEHAGTDPHLWLDPGLVVTLVPRLNSAASSALEAAGTPSSQTKSGAAKLMDDLEKFDRESCEALKPFAGRAIVTHHAAWGRFADHYGLKVAAVIRPIEASEPGAEVARETLDAIERSKATAIFVEPQFNRAEAERIARQANVKVGVLDPLGDGDWFKLMRGNVDALVKALGP